MSIDIEALFKVETYQTILNFGLDLAKASGLRVTSWRAGDPTRAQFNFLAKWLAAKEGPRVDFAKSASLSTASGDWLTLLARDVYGIDRTTAARATPKITLTNSGGGQYPLEAGELSAMSSLSGKTFRNTSTGTLSPLGTLTLDMVADEPGSGSSVSSNAIDTLVTPLLGVSIAASTAAVGLDEQDPASLEQDCKDTLGALSPDGPADAYEYVVRQKKLTGVDTITRSRSTSDSEIGEVTVYCAGPNGAVDGASITAAQAAVVRWAQPKGFRATCVSAVEDETDVTAEISGTGIPDDYETRITDALRVVYSRLPIANEDGGEYTRDMIEGEIHRVLAAAGVPLAGRKVTAFLQNVGPVFRDVTRYEQGHVPKLRNVAVSVL